jgi:hypothetical protein
MAALSVAYTATPLAAATKLLIEATGPKSQGVVFVPRSQYKYIQISAAAAVSPANALTAYVALYGALLAGKRYFFRCTVITSDGQRSAPLSAYKDT